MEFGDRVTEFDDYESELLAEAADETTSESTSDETSDEETNYDGFYVTWDFT